VPAVYLLANLAIAFTMVRGRPRETLACLAVTALGLPFFWLFGRASRTAG
jgi:hypothetical protein